MRVARYHPHRELRERIEVNRAEENGKSWAHQLANGDPEVAAEFWEQYGERLRRLADRYLSSRLQRRVGPDDIVQSACRTFLRRAQQGDFQRSDSESLWRLMCAITVAKARQKARFHHRQKRALDAEQYLDGGSDSERGAREMASREPEPDEAAGFADQLQRLLSEMEEEQQQLVQLKLQNYTNLEIADSLGCSERTVRRILKGVKSKLTRDLEESSLEPP